AHDQARREGRQRRGGGKVLGTADLDLARAEDGGLVAPQPSPEFAALVAEECGRLLGLLRDHSLRRVAHLRMEGYSKEEIARHLGCSLRTVARKVELIRRTWLDE